MHRDFQFITLRLRTTKALLVFFMCLIVQPSYGHEEGVCERLTATGNSEYPPYLWRESNENDNLLGANRIIMDEISQRLGIPIVLKHTGPWSRAQLEVKRGSVDLIAGAFYTNERIMIMDYIFPSLLDTTSVVWKKKGSNINYTSPDQLIGLSGVTVLNNSFGQIFDQFAKNKLNLHFVRSSAQLFKMLDIGRVDYALYEKNPGLAYIRLLDLHDELEVMDPPISSEGLYLTLSHRSHCNTGSLRGKLTRIVRDLIAEGFMEKALNKGLSDWEVFQNH